MLSFFPRYTQVGPSSRYRIYQYLPYFDNYKVAPFFDDSYLPSLKLKSFKGLIYLAKCYLKRIYLMFESRNNICIVQYEFTPFLLFNSLFFKLFNVKYIVDFDDAVFHDYDESQNKIVKLLFRKKIPKVIKNASHVITGSPYLTNFAKQFNTNVTEIPTSINLSNYIIEKQKTKNQYIIGWIGSRTTSIHIKLILEPLKILKTKGYNFKLNLIGFTNLDNIDFEDLDVDIIEWNKTTEISELNKIDLGIMPMVDIPFTRGKCAFKLIQYMAVAKPTISTSFEANIKVDRNNENFFANNTLEWVNTIEHLINNRNLGVDIGKRNRKVIERFYSIQNNNKKITQIIDSVLNT